MFSKIEKGVLIAFDDRDLVDGTFVVPDYVTEIEDKAFSRELFLNAAGKVEEREPSKIRKVIIPKSVKRIGMWAFSRCAELENVEISEGVEILDEDCFSYCDNLSQINIPNSVKKIGDSAFWGNPKLQSVNIFGKEYTDIEDLPHYFDFLLYAKQNHKFMPNIYIMKNTPTADIEKFYIHSKVWRKILSDYTIKWADFVIESAASDGKLADEVIYDLYSYCLALGVFEGGKQQTKAVDFIVKNLFEFNPYDLHQSLGGLGSMHYGVVDGHAFNPEFASFYMTNYHPPINKDGVEVPFLCKKVGDGIAQFAAYIYPEWSAIKKAYPNKIVLAHREHASENNSLTEKDVLDVVDEKVYDNIEEGNETLANAIAVYGYSQWQFEKMQEMWNVAKRIKKEDLILTASPDIEENAVKFELLAKNNPEGFVIGNKTNCCQKIGDAGESCVRYGITKPNSGFLAFKYGDKLLGQSWVWYNEKTQTVCLDNIEVPTIWEKKLEADPLLQTEFLKCLARFAKSARISMTNNGHPVKQVTIGAGYNDLHAVKDLRRIKVNDDVLPDDYCDYSDADEVQYVIDENVAEKQNANTEMTL